LAQSTKRESNLVVYREVILIYILFLETKEKRNKNQQQKLYEKKEDFRFS